MRSLPDEPIHRNARAGSRRRVRASELQCPSSPGVAACRSAVIGTGKISEEHLRFLSGQSGVCLVGVCDLSPSLAEYAARRFKAERAFIDYRVLLAQTRPDIVHVLTPPHTHMVIATDCLRAGAHVLLEKPAVATAAQLEELLRVAREHGRRVVESHNYLFNRTIRSIESIAASGAIGQVVDVDVRLHLGIRASGSRYADASLPHPSHQLPGGVIHEFITHMAYLLLRFLPTWDSVRAVWANHGADGLFKFDDLDALVVAGPRHGRMRFSCRQGPECFEVVVRGTDGWARTELFQPFIQVHRPRGGKLLSPVLNQVLGGVGLAGAGLAGFWGKVMGSTPYEGLALFLDRTYDALRNKAEPPVTEADMMATATLVDALVAAGARN